MSEALQGHPQNGMCHACHMGGHPNLSWTVHMDAPNAGPMQTKEGVGSVKRRPPSTPRQELQSRKVMQQLPNPSDGPPSSFRSEREVTK